MNLLKLATWRTGLGLGLLSLMIGLGASLWSPAQAEENANETHIENQCKQLSGEAKQTCRAERKAAKKAARRSERIKVKATKQRQMSQAQLANLQEQVDDARAKGKDAKVKTLAQKFKQKRQNLKQQWREALKNPDLSQSDKQALKAEFKATRQDLKALNDELREATRKRLERDLAPTELQALEAVEPNYLYEPQSVGFDDPAWSQQWGLQSVGLAGVPIPEGFALQGHEPLTVALIDSGVAFAHPDLAANKWTSDSCVDADGLEIPGGCPNGGWDFIDNDNDPYPTDNISHGTGVASIIGAVSNNQLAMASAAGDRVEVMAIRSCCTAEGFFPADSIAEGIYFAVNNGAQIVNLSLGGPTPSEQIRAALQYAAEQDVLVVAAAGNYASNNDVSPIYPANYNQELPNILSVSSTTSWDYLAYYSNYGPQTVDLAAPGQDVVAAGLNDGTVVTSGTSFSAPMTASVLAKWWQQNPQLSLGQLKADFMAALQSLDPITSQISGGKALRFEVPDSGTDPGEEPVDPVDPVDPDPVAPEEPTDPEEPADPTDPDPVDPSEPEGPTPTKCKDLDGEAKAACKLAKKRDKCLAKTNPKKRDKCLKKLGLIPGGTNSDIYTYSASGDWTWHHSDHLSGTSVETDATGQVVQLYDYYPFGDVRIDNKAAGHDNDYQFTGKERDDDTGLLYYEARYYGSDTSRFISLDPWEGDLSDPQSFNQTVYVRNNPLKYVDPSGQIYETPWDVANVVADAVSIVVGGGMYATGTITGNAVLTSVGSQAVKGGAANLGSDIAATFVPGLPAGVSKLGDVADITKGQAKRIQNAANKIGQDIHLVGSRAAGKSKPDSDWDYVIEGANAKTKGKVKNSLPRGTAGGEIAPSGRETGIDIMNSKLDRTKPHQTFSPQKARQDTSKSKNEGKSKKSDD